MYASCSSDLLTRRGPDTFIPQVAKLFAKHMKLEEQASFLASKRFLFAVGTPNRILKLLEMGALSLQQTRLVVLDSTWTDAKKRNIFDVVRKKWLCFVVNMLPAAVAVVARCNWLSFGLSATVAVVAHCVCYQCGCLLLRLSWLAVSTVAVVTLPVAGITSNPDSCEKPQCLDRLPPSPPPTHL